MKPSELIKKKGWVQHVSDCDDGYCILGAIWETCGGFSTEKTTRAMKAVQNILDSRTDYLHVGIAAWNDEAGRTKRQVLAVLRKAGL